MRFSLCLLLGLVASCTTPASELSLPPVPEPPPVEAALAPPGPHMRLALPLALEALGPLRPEAERSDEAALAEARRGRLREAALLCATDACAAEAARLGIERLGAPVYATATQVCVRATDPMACHRGVLEALAREVPPADTGTAGDWERLVQTAAVVEATWTQRGEVALAQAATEHLWATLLEQSYAVAAENTAASLAILPGGTHPLVRGALVARAARDAVAIPPETLEAWLARLPTGAEGGAGRDGEVLWRREGDRLRPTVADPAVDLRVCVLLVSGLDGMAVPEGRWRAAAQALK